ncbi:TIGR03086 family metal-binding protein [Nocardioides jiangxiensis]|uniref:TIGR03086 family metal-binding protein n=1 Tax=Nocardioides jiangxiensis TaxID=3064524 RepID=A0ABT9B0Z2_9ACTN|nr:TIGR03086 family metal-binding protein [Nocardioides sp. WY-20]MDO7868065.1 TIGR03086 family metal-binding protein [Nocardioides sp. WY-20]
MSAADAFRRTNAAFAARVHGAAPEWDDPAPCEGWVARDVVRHLVEWLPAFLEGGAAVRLEPVPSVDDDPVAAWDAFAAQVQALLEDPATAERTYTGPPGTHPLDRAIDQFFTSDLFLHTWDLARATGQDEALDPERCAAMLAGMEPWDEALRSSGHYGPRVPVAADADPQTKLLAFIGRVV